MASSTNSVRKRRWNETAHKTGTIFSYRSGFGYLARYVPRYCTLSQSSHPPALPSPPKNSTYSLFRAIPHAQPIQHSETKKHLICIRMVTGLCVRVCVSVSVCVGFGRLMNLHGGSREQPFARNYDGVYSLLQCACVHHHRTWSQATNSTILL